MKTKLSKNRSALISIIVPVYNVEPYLNRFFESVYAQTYKNYEVIIWDDGSKDNSLKICRQHAKSNDCIKVFHDENAGVAFARKRAVARASGEYITFADPDDWLAPDYLKDLLLTSLQHGVDIATCQCYEEYPDSHPRVDQMDDIECRGVLTAQQAVECLLQRDFQQGKKIPMRAELWGKLFCIDLFRNLEFPIKKTCSDIMLFANLLCRARSVAVIDNKLYHYRLSRKGSLQSHPSLGILDDMWNAHIYICKIFLQHFLIDDDYLRVDADITLLHIFGAIMRWSKTDKSDRLKNVYKINQERLKIVGYSPLLPKNASLKLHIYQNNFKIARFVYLLSGR